MSYNYDGLVDYVELNLVGDIPTDIDGNFLPCPKCGKKEFEFIEENAVDIDEDGSVNCPSHYERIVCRNCGEVIVGYDW